MGKEKKPAEKAAAKTEKAAAEELSALDKIVQQGKMARDESQQDYAQDLVGEFVNQVLDQGMTVSKDTVAAIAKSTERADGKIMVKPN